MVIEKPFAVCEGSFQAAHGGLQSKSEEIQAKREELSGPRKEAMATEWRYQIVAEKTYDWEFRVSLFRQFFFSFPS